MKRKRLLLSAILVAALCFGCSNTSKDNTDSGSSQENIITVNPKSDTTQGKSYQTITDAFTYVNQNPPTKEAERIVIEITAGTYREYNSLTAPYITLRPIDKNSEVKLTFYYGAGNYYASLSDVTSIRNTASTHITQEAHDFIAENITFENSYNIYVTEEEKSDMLPECTYSPQERSADPSIKKYQTQAVAIRIDADRSAFYNCRFLGRQDTMNFNNAARLYFEDCYAEGTADFICGDAVAVFSNCILNCPYNAGHVTASSTSTDNPFGYLFKNCSITKDTIDGRTPPEDNDFTLGRPWRSAPQVIFWNCKMGSHIATGKYRFIAMSSEYPCEGSRFIECGTMDLDGNPLDLPSTIASFQTIMTQEELNENYSIEKHLAAKFNNETKQLEKADNWKPF